MEDSDDWMIDSNGLYVATRSFLMRRGYCCGNQCRNCPYINWRNSPTWKPLEASMIHITKVSPKVLEGVRKVLAQLEQHGQYGSHEDAFHQEMVAHYRLLLTCWEDVIE